MAREMLMVLMILVWPCHAHSQGTTSLEPQFEVSLGPELEKDSYTGRLYVFLSRRNDYEPRQYLRFLDPEPVLAKDVSNLRTGQSILLSLSDSEVLRFPRDLNGKDLIGLRAQSIVRLNESDPNVFGEGNAYSDVVTVVESASMVGTRLTVNRVIPKVEFPKTERRREFTVRSSILSNFYGTDVSLNAAIILPENYDSTDNRYPVVFHIPSFGGSHTYAEPLSTRNSLGVEFLHVMLDGCCPFGHHAFADSANCGPYQTAFIEEFLPSFDQAYRTVIERRGRFLAGHSSGGWSGLWLQINHPLTFAGVWCYSPDPVDFSVFQNIDLYRQGENLFRDERGNRRPLCGSRDGRIMLWFEELSDLERVMGHGGQLGSFEAVFGPRGQDRRPVPLWNRDTGAIDPQVVKHWEKYDIHKLLKSDWPRLSAQLQGRIHIHIDEHDCYYLDGAVKQLALSFANNPGSVEVTIHPGEGHGDYMSEEFGERVNMEMAKSFLSSAPSP